MRTKHFLFWLGLLSSLLLGGCGDSLEAEQPANSAIEISDPEDTDPENTEPENTEPDDTDPDDTDPGDTDPDDTDPDDTDPDDTDPDDTEPGDTDTTIPEETDNVLLGAELYQLQCASCHGVEGTSFALPIDTASQDFSHYSDPDTALSLTDYIDLWMPVGAINDCTGDCAQDIAAYIRSWGGSLVNLAPVAYFSRLGNTLTATSTDDGDFSELTHQWFVDDLATGTSTTLDTSSFSGTLTIKLTSTDAQNLSNSMVQIIDFTAINEAPVARFSRSGDTLTVTSTDDAGSANLTHQWFVNDVPKGTGTSFDASSLSGSQTIKLTSTDAQLLANSTTQNIDFGNTIPVAVATADITSGEIPLTVTFDASMSTDTEDSTLIYLWNFSDGTSSSLATPSKVIDTAGNYTATLTVTDSANASHTTALITIMATEPVVIDPEVPALDDTLVSAYEDCDYAGTGANLPIGDYYNGALTALGLRNNTISSIKVPVGYRAVLYNTQLAGATVITTNNSACLTDLDFDNKISSLSIEIDTEVINLSNGQSAYTTSCAGCHGDSGDGIKPIDITACVNTDCSDINTLAKYIADNMPPSDATSCGLSAENIHTSCAATTAAYIANNFQTNEVIPPITRLITPLARLTNEEFVTSAMSLLGIESTSAIETAKATLAAEADVFGLLNDSSTQYLTQVALAGYINMVDVLVDEFFNDIDSKDAMLTKYDCADSVYDCGIEYTTALTATAFRRPLIEQDITEITTLFDAITADYLALGLDEWDTESHQLRFNSAMYYTLLSPDFLLMIEQGSGETDSAGNKQLSPREIANRMAFFLTGNLPDSELLAAAEADTLSNADTRLEQATRLLNSPLAEQQITNILTSWLAIDTDNLDASTGDTFDTFIMDWVSNNRAFSELYQAPISVEHTDGTNSNELMGVLGLKAFVASHTNYPTPSFITRGEFVVSRLLCEQLPDDVPADALASEGLTPVEVFESHAQDPCATCHRVFDNYGGAFQQFDGETSLFDANNTDFGSSFDLFDIGDVSNIINDLSGLSNEMAISEKAPACMTELWYRHAFRRSINANDADAVTLAALIAEWKSSGDMDIKSLLAAIVALDEFVTLYE